MRMERCPDRKAIVTFIFSGCPVPLLQNLTYGLMDLWHLNLKKQKKNGGLHLHDDQWIFQVPVKGGRDYITP